MTETTYTLLKVTLRKSRHGDDFYYAFLKSDTGKSYNSCLHPNMRNFSKWRDIVARYIESDNGCEKIVLRNLVVRGSNPKQIDADSNPIEVEKETIQ